MSNVYKILCETTQVTSAINNSFMWAAAQGLKLDMEMSQ